jgi:hypothetical protein
MRHNLIQGIEAANASIRWGLKRCNSASAYTMTKGCQHPSRNRRTFLLEHKMTGGEVAYQLEQKGNLRGKDLECQMRPVEEDLASVEKSGMTDHAKRRTV